DETLHLRRADRQGGEIALGAPPGYLPEQCRDLALEPTDAGLAGVPPHQDPEGRFGQDDALAEVEPVRGRLLRAEVSLGDPDLLVLRVAGELNDLHAIPQRLR